jgi:hypothetical protein
MKSNQEPASKRRKTQSTLEGFVGTFQKALKLLEATEQGHTFSHSGGSQLLELDSTNVPKDRVVFDPSQIVVDPIRIVANTGQIVATQRLLIAPSGTDHDHISWNILGLGEQLTYDKNSEGRFILSPSFTLSDGSVFVLKFTPFPKRGHEGDSHLTILAVPNGDEQKANQMNRKVSRILGRILKVQKNGAKPIMQKYAAFKTFTMDQRSFMFTNFAALNRNRVEANDYKNLFTIDLEFRKPINYLNCSDRPYAGLVNEGSTCYLNVYMQSLFMMNPFRRAIYELKVDADDLKDIKLCLQRLFYSLQVKHENVKTTEMCTAFGWSEAERWEQHDTDEFQLKLREFLEGGEGGNKMEEIYKKLFDFQLESRIQCRDVDYKSSNKQVQSNLTLTVKGFPSLEDSLMDNFEKIQLGDDDGNNMYDAEEHGKQVADKWNILKSLPTALQVVLNRADFDV